MCRYPPLASTESDAAVQDTGRVQSRWGRSCTSPCCTPHWWWWEERGSLQYTNEIKTIEKVPKSCKNWGPMPFSLRSFWKGQRASKCYDNPTKSDLHNVIFCILLSYPASHKIWNLWNAGCKIISKITTAFPRRQVEGYRVLRMRVQWKTAYLRFPNSNLQYSWVM